MNSISMIFIVVGVLFDLFGCIGLIRLPDVYNRLQAGTKATTLGAMSLILGIGFLNSEYLVKGIILIIFIVLTNPISSSTIARASHKSGIPLADESIVDACKDDIKEEEG